MKSTSDTLSLAAGAEEDKVPVGAVQALGKALKAYFKAHTDGHIPSGLYRRVICEVEIQLFLQTLEFTHNNQLRAAQILGINRNTLRKKIAKLK